MDVSTKQTDVEQVEVASTLKIINQENEADLAEEQINKKRRKSSGPGRTVRFDPNKRKSSGRSFGAPRSTFDNSKIKSGVCHKKIDRMGIALGFFPQKTEKKSLQYLDNLIECGLPCFKENGKQQKDIPDSFPGNCCDCCEAKNDLYQTQMFSSIECGNCVEQFIKKSFNVPKIKKCVEEKNRKINIPIEQFQMAYECFGCVDADDADYTTITIKESSIKQRSTMILESVTSEVIKEMKTTPSAKGIGSISLKTDDAREITETDLSPRSTNLPKTKTSNEKLKNERTRTTAAGRYSTQFDQIKNSVGVLNEDEGNSNDLTFMRKAQKDMESNIPSAMEWLKVVKSSPTGSIGETSFKQALEHALKVSDKALPRDGRNIKSC